MSADVIQRLGTLLRRRGTDESENEAHAVFMTGFERLSEYRFKMFAGEIRVSQMRRRVAAALKAAEANPADEAARAAHAAIRRELLDLEGAELRERQRNYPTDRSIKADLGRIEFELGNFEEAMASFQACKDDAKLRIGYSDFVDLLQCEAAELQLPLGIANLSGLVPVDATWQAGDALVYDIDTSGVKRMVIETNKVQSNMAVSDAENSG
jgi:tetratricopeptide (TPR) repeat protein